MWLSFDMKCVKNAVCFIVKKQEHIFMLCTSKQSTSQLKITGVEKNPVWDVSERTTQRRIQQHDLNWLTTIWKSTRWHFGLQPASNTATITEVWTSLKPESLTDWPSQLHEPHWAAFHRQVWGMRASKTSGIRTRLQCNTEGWQSISREDSPSLVGLHSSDSHSNLTTHDSFILYYVQFDRLLEVPWNWGIICKGPLILF